MTDRARIYQSDMNSAFKAVAHAGFERARVVMDLENSKIEVIIGESTIAVELDEEWTDDD